jgi:hypothetical protein
VPLEQGLDRLELLRIGNAVRRREARRSGVLEWATRFLGHVPVLESCVRPDSGRLQEYAQGGNQFGKKTTGRKREGRYASNPASPPPKPSAMDGVLRGNLIGRNKGLHFFPG